MFNIGVHENHLFLASLLAAALYWTDPTFFSTFATWALLANLNLFIFYGLDGQGLPFNRVIGVDLPVVFSLVSLACFSLLLKAALVSRACRPPRSAPVPHPSP